MLDWLTLFGRNILDVELLCRSTTSFVANFTEISIGILDPRKNKARQIEMNDTYKFCGSTVRAGRRILAKPIRRGSFSAAGRAEGRPAGPPAASLRARVRGMLLPKRLLLLLVLVCFVLGGEVSFFGCSWTASGSEASRPYNVEISMLTGRINSPHFRADCAAGCSRRPVA